MKKQRLKHKASQKKQNRAIPVGRVILELAIWDFSGDEELIRHNANQLAKALLLSYQLNNFGPNSFGISDEE